MKGTLGNAIKEVMNRRRGKLKKFKANPPGAKLARKAKEGKLTNGPYY